MRYVAIVMAIALTGCLTNRYIPVTSYVLEPRIEVKQVTPTDKTLGIRSFEPARPYRQAIAYRAANYELGSYDNVQWAELPASVVTRAVSDALAATRHFKDVGDAANLLSPSLILTGQLRRFDEDRTTNPWTAVVELHLALRDTSNPDNVWGTTLTAAQPLETNNVSALPAAMSKAVSEVVNKAANEIAAR